jgi:urate oxidase
VQHTLYAMANAALAACADITEVTLTLPNRHHVLVDLSPFGLDNPNDVFVATDQPYGVIEATVRRDDKSSG